MGQWQTGPLGFARTQTRLRHRPGHADMRTFGRVLCGHHCGHGNVCLGYCFVSSAAAAAATAARAALRMASLSPAPDSRFCHHHHHHHVDFLSTHKIVIFRLISTTFELQNLSKFLKIKFIYFSNTF